MIIAPFPEEHRTTLLERLDWFLKRTLDEDDLPYDRAFIHVALDILGYEIDQNSLSDGRGDCGIDYWVMEERGATIFQFKSHDFTYGLIPTLKADPTYIVDLPRIAQLLNNLNEIPEDANSKVQTFLKELRSAVYRYSLTEAAKSEPFEITIYFCCLAQGFTSQAEGEFTKYAAIRQATWGEHTLSVSVSARFIDDFIAAEWRESNTDWRNSEGKPEEHIELHVCGEMITSPKSLVFFTKAYDLVQAFDRFGYQMFEPNVRCELKRSKVNEAIRESVKHSRGRKEFKHLNNGITLICASFQKVNRNSELSIRVRQPGVINGLQTVKSIHDAFDELDDKGKSEFTADCELLLRLHTRQAVADYKNLVKSTNNQNPMQARNLRSNEPEQLFFERLFADINWFYERKEGAWTAFRSDSSLWGSLRGKKVSDFRSSVIKNTIRNIDNLDMAQAWLSFIGFSDQAIHNKRDIFDGEKLYDLIFKNRVVKHGFDYNLSPSDPAVRADAENQAPNVEFLLLSYLLREIADGLTPSRNKNREDSVKRLRLEKEKKEVQDAELVKDSAYIRGLVLAGAKYLFVDFCGLVLFRALGAGFYERADMLLNTRSMKPMYTDRNLEPLSDTIDGDNYDQADIFAVLWALYNYCLENIIEQNSWRQQFEQAAVRSRFNYSDYNRRTLFAQLENLDRVYQRRPIPHPWSEGIEQHKGIFAYVSATCGAKKRAAVRA